MLLLFTVVLVLAQSASVGAQCTSNATVCGGCCVTPDQIPKVDLCGVASGGCSGLLPNRCVECNPDAGEIATDVASASVPGYYPQNWAGQPPIATCTPVPVPVRVCNSRAAPTLYSVFPSDVSGLDVTTRYWLPGFTGVGPITPTSQGCMVGFPHGDFSYGFVEQFSDDKFPTLGLGTPADPKLIQLRAVDIYFDVLIDDGIADVPMYIVVRPNVFFNTTRCGLGNMTSHPDHTVLLGRINTTVATVKAMTPDASGYRRFTFNPPLQIASSTYGFSVGVETDFTYGAVSWNATQTQACIRFTPSLAPKTWSLRIFSSRCNYRPPQSDANNWGAENGDLDIKLLISNCELDSGCTAENTGCDDRCYSLNRATNRCGQCANPTDPAFNVCGGECVTADGRPGYFASNGTECGCVFDPCAIPRIHTLDEYRRCVETIPIVPRVHAAARDSALSVLQFHPTIGDLRNATHRPLTNYQSADVREQIDDILDDDAITRDYHFHARMHRIINQFADCHAVYSPPPLYTLEFWGIPLNFGLHFDRIGESQYLTIEPPFGSSIASQFTLDTYRSVSGIEFDPSAFFGWIVYRINDEDPAHAIQTHTETRAEHRMPNDQFSTGVQTRFGDSSFLSRGGASALESLMHNETAIRMRLRNPTDTSEVVDLVWPLVGIFTADAALRHSLVESFVIEGNRAVPGGRTLANLDTMLSNWTLDKDEADLCSFTKRSLSGGAVVSIDTKSEVSFLSVFLESVLDTMPGAMRDKVMESMHADVNERDVAPQFSLLYFIQSSSSTHDFDYWYDPHTNVAILHSTAFGQVGNLSASPTASSGVDAADAIIRHIGEHQPYLFIDMSSHSGGHAAPAVTYLLNFLDPMNRQNVGSGLSIPETSGYDETSHRFNADDPMLRQWYTWQLDLPEGGTYGRFFGFNIFSAQRTPLGPVVVGESGIFNESFIESIHYAETSETIRYATHLIHAGPNVRTTTFWDAYPNGKNATPIAVDPKRIFVFTGASTYSGGSFATHMLRSYGIAATTVGVNARYGADVAAMHAGQCPRSGRTIDSVSSSSIVGIYDAILCDNVVNKTLWANRAYYPLVGRISRIPDVSNMYDLVPDEINRGVYGPENPGSLTYYPVDCQLYGDGIDFLNVPLATRFAQVATYLKSGKWPCGCADADRDCQGTCFGKAIDCPRFGEDDCDAADPQPCQMTDACGSCGASADSTGAYGSGQLVVEGWPPPQGVAVVADTW